MLSQWQLPRFGLSGSGILQALGTRAGDLGSITFATLDPAILTTTHGFVSAALAIESALDRKELKPARPGYTRSCPGSLNDTGLPGERVAMVQGKLPDVRQGHNGILRPRRNRTSSTH